MYKSQPSLPSQKRHSTYQHYAKVLRQLHTDSDADAIELAANTNDSQPATGKSAESKQINLPQDADRPSLPAQTAPVLKPVTREEQHQTMDLDCNLPDAQKYKIRHQDNNCLRHV